MSTQPTPVGRDSVEPQLERSEASAASISVAAHIARDARYARAACVGRWGSTESHPTRRRAFAAALIFLAFLPALLAADLEAQRAEGQRIAAEARSLSPKTSSTNTAVLKVRDHRGVRSQIPVTIRTTVSDAQWHTDYISGDGLLFRVTRSPNTPSRYATGRVNGAAPQPAGNLLVPFAGSDFWLVDLGLDFFHWPEQRLVKKEQRRGEACFVLESTTPKPAPGGYSRVVAWLDQDTLGIVAAEAYDTRGKLMKEFEPKSFKKVNGQWRLKEMEIRNEQTDSRTSLIFDVEVQ